MIAVSHPLKRAISFQTHHLETSSPGSARHGGSATAGGPPASRDAGLYRAAGLEAIKRAVAAAQPPGAVRVQRGDVQIALNARRQTRAA